MDATELAHWRYHAKALFSDVAFTTSILKRLKLDPYAHSYMADEIVAVEDQLRYEKWLLEEARYKVELGHAVPDVPRSEAGTTGTTHRPCVGHPCQVREHWEPRA